MIGMEARTHASCRITRVIKRYGEVQALRGTGLVFAGVAWMVQSREHEKMYG